MDSFEVYVKDGCAYCDLAVAILRFDGKAVNVVNIKENPEVADILQKHNAKSLPRIFHNGNYIGGYNELIAYLESQER